MTTPSTSHKPLPALGMSSLVLGTVALVLAVLPVLGIPVSACGLALGLAGLVAALFGGNASLRWSLAGLAVCSLALGIGLAIAYAPGNDRVGRGIPRPWPGVPDRPFVSPPSRGEID